MYELYVYCRFIDNFIKIKIMTQPILYISKLFEYLQLTKSFPCVIKFTVTESASCENISPTFQLLAEKYCEKVKFLEIDINKAKIISNHEDVKSIPLFLFYYNQQKLTDFSFNESNTCKLSDLIVIFISKITRIKSIDYIDNLKEYLNYIKNFPCIIKFTASWSIPCEATSIMYHLLANKYCGAAKFLEIDVNSSNNIVKHENLKSIPTFIFYYNNEKLDDLSIIEYADDTLENILSTFITVISK